MNRDVFLSILAMDAYNRGYGAGVGNLPESGSIGNATIRPFNVSEQNGWQAAGFYAIAYRVSGVAGIEDGTKVISYRGSDHVEPVNWEQFVNSSMADDIWNGWSIFTGFGTNSHAALAIWSAANDNEDTALRATA